MEKDDESICGLLVACLSALSFGAVVRVNIGYNLALAVPCC